MGHHETGNLAVFLNNRGEVTAYSATGHKLWQVPLPFMALSDGDSQHLIEVTHMIVTQKNPVSSWNGDTNAAEFSLWAVQLLLVGRLSPDCGHRLQQSPNHQQQCPNPCIPDDA